MSSPEDGEGGSYRASVDPLYERLPHGPHRLDHNQVIRNQRARIQGAMVEAVAASSYEAVSVRQVVALAGVSRRSFYELYSNKQECFLQTFDVVAARGIKRIRAAYEESEGPLEDRLRIAFRHFTEGVKTNWKDARLAIVEAQTILPAGLDRLLAATAACERMVFATFKHAPDANPLPMPIVRGIVGGLHGAIATCLREGQPGELPGVSEELLRWTLVFQSAAAAAITERVIEPPPPRSASEDGRAPEKRARARSATAEGNVAVSGDRSRLMHEALRLALIEDYKELSAPLIADEAGVPIDAFFELFAGKDECYLAAVDTLGAQLMQVVADPELLHGDWPRAVRRVIADVTRFLADRPLYAQTLAVGAFAAGPKSAARILEIGRSVSTLLVEGAPQPARTSIALEGIRAALGHTIRCEVASDEIQHLPALSDYISYIVLAPFIGADAAAAIVTES
jgi:AcrR family transcriptional regulator